MYLVLFKTQLIKRTLKETYESLKKSLKQLENLIFIRFGHDSQHEKRINCLTPISKTRGDAVFIFHN